MAKNVIEYNGFVGKVDYDAEDRMLHGTVLGTNTVLSFAGKNGTELDKSVHIVVDDYLACCKETGVEPERTWKGKMTFRPKSDALRQKMALHAQLADVSINDWLNTVVERAIAG